MHMTSSLLFASLLLLLLPSIDMKKSGKGRGLKGARHKLTGGRVRSAGRHSRSGAFRLVSRNCSESAESGDVFVDCQDRGLTSVPNAQTWSKAPKHLLLASNRIKVLREGTFFGYESLATLDLQQNHISSIEEGAFQGLAKLKTLLLQHNRLETLNEEALIPMPNIRYLRLHHNPWNCLCSMDGLIITLQVPSNRNLGKHARCAAPIRLKDRKLKQIDPELLCKASDPTGFPQGDQTDTSGPLVPVPFRSKPDITTSCHTYHFPQIRIDCKKRGGLDISVKLRSWIEAEHISQRLYELTLQNSPGFLRAVFGVTDLDGLTEVPAGVPEDVVRVDLSNNLIRHLRAKDFQTARNLRFLNLSNNNIEHIDTASLSGLLHLHELDLSHNSLHFIKYGVLEDLYFLSQLKLGGNPWVCDYSIHYMVYWLRLHPGVRHSGLICRSPPEHTGEQVEAYVKSYFRVCPRDKQSSRTDQEQTDPRLWNTPMEAQGELEEEELEPSHLRVPQKYTIFRLS